METVWLIFLFIFIGSMITAGFLFSFEKEINLKLNKTIENFVA